VVPRPIAWVLTQNIQDPSPGELAVKKGFNLAPFSYFNAVCSEPPLLMISVGKKPNGDQKDTRANIVRHERLVVHIPSEHHIEDVTQSAATLPYGESEIDLLGVELVEESGWDLPRLAQCDIAMYCTLYDVQEIGPNKQALVFAEIQQLYVNDSVVGLDHKERAKVDAAKVSPLGRLGASEYASFGNVRSSKRPK